MASSTNDHTIRQCVDVLEKELRNMKRKPEFKDIPDPNKSNGLRKIKLAVERKDIRMLEESFETLETEIHCANHIQLLNSPDSFTGYTEKKNALLQAFRNSKSLPSENICDSASRHDMTDLQGCIDELEVELERMKTTEKFDKMPDKSKKWQKVKEAVKTRDLDSVKKHLEDFETEIFYFTNVKCLHSTQLCQNYLRIRGNLLQNFEEHRHDPKDSKGDSPQTENTKDTFNTSKALEEIKTILQQKMQCNGNSGLSLGDTAGKSQDIGKYSQTEVCKSLDGQTIHLPQNETEEGYNGDKPPQGHVSAERGYSEDDSSVVKLVEEIKAMLNTLPQYIEKEATVMNRNGEQQSEFQNENTHTSGSSSMKNEPMDTSTNSEGNHDEVSSTADKKDNINNKSTEELQHEVERLKEVNVELQKKVEAAEKEKSEKRESHYSDKIKTEMRRLQSENESCKNSHTELQNKIETLEREKTDLQRQSRSGRTSSHDIDRYEAEIKRLSSEKEHWKNRLSVMTENTLTKNNPTITDLSDPNRPSKLAEKFGELYDNTWTDAFEVLCREMNQQHCIKTLAEFLKGCYELCVGISNKQMEDVERVLSTLTVDPRSKPCMKELPRGFVEARKECADKALAYVQKVVGNQVKERYVGPNVISKVPKYVEACTAVCWGMVIQEPKVCFLWPKQGKSTVVDMDLFSLYTRNGRGIEFVVWPAMLLHENGPLLRKGTVQPYEIPQKRR